MYFNINVREGVLLKIISIASRKVPIILRKIIRMHQRNRVRGREEEPSLSMQKDFGHCDP